MRKEFFLPIVFFLLMACASSDKSHSVETQVGVVSQSVQKSASRDSARIDIPKEFLDSLYHEWSLEWKKNYSQDTALYQGFTNCMYPDSFEDEEGVIVVECLVGNGLCELLGGLAGNLLVRKKGL